MADPRKRLALNVIGDFFVDSTCIDCDTCRHLAPEVFQESGEYSIVYQQPESEAAHRNTLRALLACPTGSIGSMVKQPDLSIVKRDFPIPIDDEVSYCGFASEDSYGASSYFFQHPDGNWLIDSPKYLPYLREKFESLGGIKFIFLTHQDDVADAARYALEFGATRIIHRSELRAQPEAECIIDGVAEIEFAPDFRIIPTPGHTRGSMCLLVKDRYLFSGDHFWWSRTRGGFNASKSVCWYSWPEQLESLAKLQAHSFEWVLPGHGERKQFEPTAMQRELARMLARV